MVAITADKMLQQVFKLFYLSGIWHSDGESDYRIIFKNCSYSLFAASAPIFFVIHIFRCADRNESINSAQIAIIMSVVYVKFLYLLCKKQEILAFLNDPIVVHSNKYREEYDHANRKIEKLMKFLHPYCVAIIITAVLLIVINLPMFSAGKGLPFFINFTWNVSEIFYWLAYFIISLSIVFYVTVNFISVLIWYIMLNYSIAYELLGKKI